MTQSIDSASLKQVFRFPLQGPEWKNRFLIGCGLMLASFFIPIVPLVFVCGYTLALMRRIAAGEEPALPAWDDWGRLGMDGLRSMFASFVYLLPGTVVYCGGLLLYLACFFAMPFLAVGPSRHASLAVLLAGFLPLVGMGILMVSICLGTVLFVLGAVPLPVAATHIAVKGNAGAAFNVREWWPILRANKLGFFIDWVIAFGLAGLWYLGYMLLAYSMVLCIILPVVAAPALFYVSLVSAARFAQSYRCGELAARWKPESVP